MADNAPHDTSAPHAAVSDSAEAPLFSPVEVEQFSADDVTAGSAIGKMLSALFLYTIVAMGIAGWWTYSSIIADNEYSNGALQGDGADQGSEAEAH